MAHTQDELNRHAWRILVGIAHEHDYITYGQLANRINELIGTKYTQKNIGQIALDKIERHCIKNGLPDLTGLVVRQESEIPGKDFFVANGGYTDEQSEAALRYRWIQIRECVWQTPWPSEPPNNW